MLLSDPLKHYPAHPLPGTIRIVPRFSTAAIQCELDKELSLWYCLRAINFWGSGHLSLRMAIEALGLHFHCSKSTVCKILSSGEGIFWDKRLLQKMNRLQIKIYGLEGRNPLVKKE